MKIYRKKYFIPAVVVILYITLGVIGIKISQQTIKEIITNAGSFGVIVFIFLTWLTNIIAPLSGTPFLFVGFYLFGHTVVIYSFVAAIIASITNFLIAKIWGKPLVEKLTGKNNLKKLDSMTENYGLPALFILRIFLGGFHDVISYAFGLTTLKFLPYFIVSTIGMIPGTLLWYYLSSKLSSALSFTVLSLIIAYVFLSGYVLLRKISAHPPRA